MKLNSKGIDIDLCPAAQACTYKEHCTLSSVHTNCGLFRKLVLEKLGMEEYPLFADIERYKNLAYPLKN